MKQQQPGARPGAAGQVYNQLAALGPAQPTKKPPSAPAAVALLKSPPRPALDPLGSRYSDYGDRYSLSDYSLQQQQQAPHPPEKESRRQFWHSKDKGAKDVQPPRNAAGARQESSHAHGGSAYDEPTKDLTRRIGEPDPPPLSHHSHSHHNDPRRPTPTLHPQPVITFTPRNITKSIGYFAATASEDFALVYDVCNRASARVRPTQRRRSKPYAANSSVCTLDAAKS